MRHFQDSRFTPPSVEKLAALVPPPRIHLTRFHGCLAPHAKIRSQIVPKKGRRMGWAELLARVFAIDMKNCPQCGSENFKPVAAIIEISAIWKILTHLGLPDKPPDITPPRLSPQIS